MFKVSYHQLSHKPEVFSEVQYGFVDWVLWQLVPYQLQNFLELIHVLRLGLKWLVAFKHSSWDMVVQRVEVKRVQRPFIFTDEFTAVGSNPVMSQLCCVCRRAVLLKDAARLQNRSAFLNKFRQQGFKIKFSIHFGLPYPYIRIKRVDKPQLNRNIKHVNSDIQLDPKVS